MGAKEKRLGQILDKYYVRSNSKVDIKDILNSNYQSEILDVYTQLDGVRENYNFRGKWDFVFKDFILELDEEAHFNRYRALTLNSTLYDEIPCFPINKYKDFCKRYEDRCLKKDMANIGQVPAPKKCLDLLIYPRHLSGLVVHAGSKELFMIM